MTLIQDYIDLTAHHIKQYGEKTVVLMQVGSFYEIYANENPITGELYGSKMADIISLCGLKKGNKIADKTTYKMAGFSWYMLDKYIDLLRSDGYTSVVYNQDEDEEGNTIRNLDFVISPGTYFALEENTSTNNTMCVRIHSATKRHKYLNTKYIIIGMTNVDIITGKIVYNEYMQVYSHNHTTYDELERFSSIYKPSEVIILVSSDEITENAVSDILQYANINTDTVHTVFMNASVQQTTTANTYETKPLSNTNNRKQRKTQHSKHTKKQTQQHTELLEKYSCPENNNIEKANHSDVHVYQRAVLKKYYPSMKEEVMNEFDEHPIALSSTVYLLNFLYEHNPNLVYKISTPLQEKCSNTVGLANHSLRQLNIIPDSNYTGKLSSVTDFLNSCKTPMGKREFKSILQHPITDGNILQREYDLTEYLFEKYDDFIPLLRNVFIEMKDMEKYIRAMFIKKFNPADLSVFYHDLDNVIEILNITNDDPVIDTYLQNNANYNSNTNSSVMNASSSRQILETIRTSTMDIQEYITERVCIDQCDNGADLSTGKYNRIINKGISEELDVMINTYVEAYTTLNNLRGYLNKLVSEKDNKKKKSTTEYVKFHIPEKSPPSIVCTERRAKIITEQLKYITKKQKVDLINADIDISLLDNITCIKSTKSNTSLINDKIIGLCKTVYSGKDKIFKLENELFKSIIAEFINTYHDDIETITGIITQLDVAQAKTYNAYKYNYCKPTLDIGGTKANADSNDELSSYVDFEDIRHPLIEQLLNKKGESYVTNNLKLGNISEDCCDYEYYNGMLLYGTNAVGKTSLIRAIGISVIMAQAGMFVPCSRFTYRPYKYIFTRILGNDNIFKGLSTFAVEMTELRTILKYCDKNSLILGDELCSGTESDSAIAIFVTGLMKLHEIGSCFIFATHFHEIVKFEEVLDLDRLTMKHMKVIYNRETGKLEYDRKLTDGHGDSMYGLEVCEAMHLPADFVKCARNIRLKYSSTAEGGNTSVLGLKHSRYNAAVLMGDCVKCGKKGEDIHHLQHQSEADNRGFIGSMHKNHSSNLVSLCRKCHDLEHAH